MSGESSCEEKGLIQLKPQMNFNSSTTSNNNNNNNNNSNNHNNKNNNSNNNENSNTSSNNNNNINNNSKSTGQFSQTYHDKKAQSMMGRPSRKLTIKTNIGVFNNRRSTSCNNNNNNNNKRYEKEERTPLIHHVPSYNLAHSFPIVSPLSVTSNHHVLSATSPSSYFSHSNFSHYEEIKEKEEMKEEEKIEEKMNNLFQISQHVDPFNNNNNNNNNSTLQMKCYEAEQEANMPLLANIPISKSTKYETNNENNEKEIKEETNKKENSITGGNTILHFSPPGSLSVFPNYNSSLAASTTSTYIHATRLNKTPTRQRHAISSQQRCREEREEFEEKSSLNINNNNNNNIGKYNLNLRRDELETMKVKEYSSLPMSFNLEEGIPEKSLNYQYGISSNSTNNNNNNVTGPSFTMNTNTTNNYGPAASINTIGTVSKVNETKNMNEKDIFSESISASLPIPRKIHNDSLVMYSLPETPTSSPLQFPDISQREEKQEKHQQEEDQQQQQQQNNNNNNNNNINNIIMLKSRRWYSLRPMSLACTLIPYFLILTFVAIACTLTPNYVSKQSILYSTEDLHEYLRLELDSHVMSALNIPHVVSTVLIGLYIKHENNPSESDDIVPMGINMTQRLCATLQYVDRQRLLTSAYVASVSRDEIALCTRGFHPIYFATFKEGKIKDNNNNNDNNNNKIMRSLIAVDPDTAQIIDPPIILKEARGPFTLRELLYNYSRTGGILDAWKREIDAGKEPTTPLWRIETFLNPRYVYTHPFLEKDKSVSFVKVALDFDRVIDLMMDRQKRLNPSLRVMILEDNGDNLTIVGSSWNQIRHSAAEKKKTDLGSFGLNATETIINSSTSIDSNSEDVILMNSDEGGGVELPLIQEVDDSLMLAALKYINLEEVMKVVRRGDSYFKKFPFNNSVAGFSLCRVTSQFNASVIIAIASPSVLFEPLDTLSIIMGIFLAVITIGYCIMVFCLFNVCVSKPLREIAIELRMATKVENKPPRENIVKCLNNNQDSSLIEIYKMQKVCASLRDQLTRLRSFLPQGLFQIMDSIEGGESSGHNYSGNSITESLKITDNKNRSAGDSLITPTAIHSTNTYDSSIKGNMLSSRSEDINIFTDIICSIVSIQFLDIETIIEYAGDIASIVEEIATKYNGRIDIFSPELFHINFGSHRKSETDKIDATYCAIEIQKNLPDYVRSSCTIVVDTGTFHFGVCGGPEKKELVLWGRSISSEIIHIQNHYGVPLVMTQSIIPYIRLILHVLPFASLSINILGMPPTIILYTIIDDITDEKSWKHIEEIYCLGFKKIIQQDYIEAYSYFEKLSTLSQVTPQIMRFVRYYLTKTKRYCNKEINPSSFFGSIIKNENQGIMGDRLDVLNSPWSPESAVETISSATEGQQLSIQSRHARGKLESITSHSATSAPQSSIHNNNNINRGISHEFLDKSNVQWRRAAESFPEFRRFPVFLGISNTGTLAALKFVPLTSLAAVGYNELHSLEQAWSRAQTLYHENIVQILGFARAKSFMCLIMEYVPAGTLRDTVSRYGRPLPIMCIKRFLVSTLRGLEYLHKLGFVHGNVRPETIMVAVEGLYKLRGISKVASTLREASVLELQAEYYNGGAAYCSPEVFNSGKRSPAADIYAVGLVLLEMIIHKTPWRWTERAMELHANSFNAGSRDNYGGEFNNNNNMEETELTMRQQYEKKMRAELLMTLSDYAKARVAVSEELITVVDIPSDIDPILREILQSCLAKDPTQRKTASEILQILSNMP